MIRVRLATSADQGFLHENEHDIDPVELSDIQHRGRTLVAEVTGQNAGWLRWGLFWDTVPFMIMLFVLEKYRGLGVGRRLVDVWERQRVEAGRTMVLTSTMANEAAQHFYRKLGYVDTGSLLLPGEVTEIVLRKHLHEADGNRG